MLVTLFLSDRLTELEQEGLITKKIYPEIPPKVEYRLTPKTKRSRTNPAKS